MSRNNKAWSDKIIKSLDPTFKHRWDVYSELLCSFLSKEITWVDVGCGNNVLVGDHGEKAKLAVGIDVSMPKRSTSEPFVVGSINSLPIRSASVDLVTLRFVVEHLKDVEGDFLELHRILKPDGRLIVLTTNGSSPFIFLPRLIPYRLKNWLLNRIYKVDTADIFPTYHRFNSVHRMKKGAGGLRLQSLRHIQDANYVRKWIFLPFFFWHLVTKPRVLQFLRTNILAVFVKQG